MLVAFTLGLGSSLKVAVNETRSLWCCGRSFLFPYGLGNVPSPSRRFAAKGKTTFSLNADNHRGRSPSCCQLIVHTPIVNSDLFPREKGMNSPTAVSYD